MEIKNLRKEKLNSEFFKGVVVGLLGILFCYNALLDFIQGPISFQAEVVKEVTSHAKIYRTQGFSPTINTRVEFKKGDGTFQNIKVRRLQVNKWDSFWKNCYSPSGRIVDVAALSHLKIFLNLKCLEIE